MHLKVGNCSFLVRLFLRSGIVLVGHLNAVQWSVVQVSGIYAPEVYRYL